VSLIYQFLGHPALRIAASEALVSIVSKKMGAVEKLNLLTFLNLNNVLGSLDFNEDVEFSESVARLVNGQGLDLTRILLEVSLPPALRLTKTNPSSDLGAKSIKLLLELLPHLLRFVADDYDDTSMAVFPFLTELLVLVSISANLLMIGSALWEKTRRCRTQPFRPTSPVAGVVQEVEV
jgi:exportin-T